jgi:hypothetical protein
MTTAREDTVRLAELLGREHQALAEFLVALSVFDRERRWVELGYASLFDFLRRELKLSAGAAQYRKTAATLIQSYPEIEAALRCGDLCLSSTIEVAKVITPENAAEVLPRFFGKSARDARVRRGCHPSGREPAGARVLRHPGSRRARRGGAGCHCGCVSDVRSGIRVSAGQRPVLALVRCSVSGPVFVDGFRPSQGSSARRGAGADQHDRVAPSPRQARHRARRPLPLSPGRFRGDHPRARARPHHRPPPEASRDRREAAGQGGARRRGAGLLRVGPVLARSPARGRGDLCRAIPSARPASASSPDPPLPLHLRGGQARGVGARRWPVRVQARERRRLRLDLQARVRSRRRLRARRGQHRRRAAPRLPLPPDRQPAPPLRGRARRALRPPDAAPLLGAGGPLRRAALPR